MIFAAFLQPLSTSFSSWQNVRVTISDRRRNSLLYTPTNIQNLRCVLTNSGSPKNKETTTKTSNAPPISKDTISIAEKSIKTVLSDLTTLLSKHGFDYKPNVISTLITFNEQVNTWAESHLISHPNPSFLPELIDTLSTSDKTSPRTVIRSMRLFCARILSQLDHQRISLSYSFSSTTSSSNTLSVHLQQAQQVILRTQPQHGPIYRVNVYWNAIPSRLLPAHGAIKVASQSFEGKLCLSRVPRDSLPAKRARAAAHVTANNYWRLLGLAEESGPLSTNHTTTLAGWRCACNSIPSSKLTLEDRFQDAYLPNALIAYVMGMRRRMINRSKAPAWCDAVALFEVGTFLHKLADTVLLAATPAAMVRYRDENDFWMWSSQAVPLIVAVQPPFGSTRDKRKARFQLKLMREEVGIREWVEAQICMLCCGDNVMEAHVLSYAPYGGMRIFRVVRNEEFLRIAAGRSVKFVQEYVWKVYPPPTGFQEDEEFHHLVEIVKNGCETVTLLQWVAADLVEAELNRFRDLMTDWEKNRSGEVFWQTKSTGTQRSARNTHS